MFESYLNFTSLDEYWKSSWLLYGNITLKIPNYEVASPKFVTHLNVACKRTQELIEHYLKSINSCIRPLIYAYTDYPPRRIEKQTIIP